MKLPFEVYDGMCNAQLSVSYLKHCLDTINPRFCEGLCCYCGLQLLSQNDCIEHENQEHIRAD